MYNWAIFYQEVIFMKEFEKKGISRRDFIKAVGTGTAAVAAVAAVKPLEADTVWNPGASAGGGVDPYNPPGNWDLDFDVVIIGSGAVGLPAAIRARDAGASVLVVDCNYDIGGHAMTSGGSTPIGGGTSWQKKYGIVDTPDIYFQDLTDWSVTKINGAPEYRYNDRGIHRAMADNGPACFDFLLANGVPFVDAPATGAGSSTGVSAPRSQALRWVEGQNAESPAGAGGTQLVRPLERSARSKGVQFLLNYHMDTIFRDGRRGRVVGVQASYTPTILPGTSGPLRSFITDGNINRTTPTVTIRARRAVVVGTGGSTGNVEFRRIFDPRLTAEFPLEGGEYSPQDGSGELAAMAIGASLWGTTNQTTDRNGTLRRVTLVGTRDNYIELVPDSPIFPRVKYTGVEIRNYQNAILVNQVGRRVYNEMNSGYPGGANYGFYNNFGGYVHGDWRNPLKINYTTSQYFDAALTVNEGSAPPFFSSGPQWAIFDSDTIERCEIDVTRSDLADPNYFFSADTLSELATKITTCPWSTYRMEGSILEETVRRYNTFVDSGTDEDFAKPTPQFKIQKAPFYAAWAAIWVHDCYVGLRIGMRCEVQDMQGNVVPGLFCGGESAGGCSQHGLARCLVQGYIIGKECLA